MATFKPVGRYQRADGLYQVYIRITHKTKIAYIKTSLVVNAKGIRQKEVKDSFVLRKCLDIIDRYNEILNKVDTDSMSIKHCVALINTNTASICFSDYAREYINELINQGQERSAKNYQLALQSLERYCGSNKLSFSTLTSFVINGWIETLSKTSRAKEMYPICMRQVFREALKQYNDYDTGEILIKTNPWPKVSIPKSDVPEKKAITIEQCREFFSAPLPPSDLKLPLAEMARDVALMSLCLAGINTIDLFYLQKSDYNNGIISYERKKTRKARRDNAYMEMRVPDIIKPLFKKYEDSMDSPFLLNFHSRLKTPDSFNANINIGIKQICQKSLGMQKDERMFSAYTFRHTWATIAQNDCEASIHEVAFALNHTAGHVVTRGYIKINFEPAWLLNEKVIDLIFFSNKSSKQVELQKADTFERFSSKYMMKGTLFFRGRKMASLQDIGYNNVNEIINALMAQLPKDMPSGCQVEIRIENIDKGQKKDYIKLTP